jgi:AcrR family transcriptional regulator
VPDASTPRYLKPEVRRRQILDAAARVIARRGFPATRISDIAKQAKVAHGTVYRFFDSKEDVASALFEEGGMASRAALEQLLLEEPQIGAMEVLRRYIKWYATYLAEHRMLVIALFSWELDPLGRSGGDLGDRKWISDEIDGLVARSGLDPLPTVIRVGSFVPLSVYAFMALSANYTAVHTDADAVADGVALLIQRMLRMPSEK